MSWGIAGSRLAVGMTGFVTHSYCVLAQLTTQNSSMSLGLLSWLGSAGLRVEVLWEGNFLLWTCDVSPALEAIHSLVSQAKIFQATSADSRQCYVFYKTHLHISYSLNCEEERS